MQLEGFVKKVDFKPTQVNRSSFTHVSMWVCGMWVTLWEHILRWPLTWRPPELSWSLFAWNGFLGTNLVPAVRYFSSFSRHLH